jgi:hypothetical protein
MTTAARRRSRTGKRSRSGIRLCVCPTSLGMGCRGIKGYSRPRSGRARKIYEVSPIPWLACLSLTSQSDSLKSAKRPNKISTVMCERFDTMWLTSSHRAEAAGVATETLQGQHGQQSDLIRHCKSANHLSAKDSAGSIPPPQARSTRATRSEASKSHLARRASASSLPEPPFTTIMYWTNMTAAMLM